MTRSNAVLVTVMFTVVFEASKYTTRTNFSVRGCCSLVLSQLFLNISKITDVVIVFTRIFYFKVRGRFGPIFPQQIITTA